MFNIGYIKYFLVNIRTWTSTSVESRKYRGSTLRRRTDRVVVRVYKKRT